MPVCRRRTLPSLLLALIPGLCATSSVQAQQPDRPLALPKSDVAIIYQFENMPSARLYRKFGAFSG